MLSVYLVKVKFYNDISVPGVEYAMLSVYLVKVKVCYAIRVPVAG